MNGCCFLPKLIRPKQAVKTNNRQNVIMWHNFYADQEKELRHRKVKHYGYEFKYSINNVDPDEPLLEGIPEVYRKLLDKALVTGHVKYYPDQLTINQYQPGQGGYQISLEIRLNFNKSLSF